MLYTTLLLFWGEPDVEMAVVKTTETRCRDGSVQARHVMQRLHPYIFEIIL